MDEEDIDPQELADRIIELREEREWNQARLARESKITAAALSQIEKGGRMPTLSVTAKLADALNVSIDDLVGRAQSTPTATVAELRTMKSNYKWFGSLSEPVQERLVDLAVAVQAGIDDKAG